MSKEYPSYNVYKGLQKPLIFKGFKGKFIYIGGACIISALLLCAIVSTLASFMWGGITLVIVMFGGLGITSQLQRKGLHRKDKRKRKDDTKCREKLIFCRKSIRRSLPR